MPNEKPIPQQIPIEKIHDLPGVPIIKLADKTYGGLVTSMLLDGVKEPVILRQREDGEYQLVSGFRRRKAAELAKLKELPALVYDMTEKEAMAYCEKRNAENPPPIPGKLIDPAAKTPAADKEPPKAEKAAPAEKKAEATGKPLPQRITVAKALVQKAAAAQNSTLDAANLSKEELEVMGGLTKKRGVSETPFRTIERETVLYKLKEAASKVAEALKSAGITGNEIGEITPAMLASGEWKKGSFRGYNIGVPPARMIPGRTNPYVQFLESVKDKLCSLGFEEFDGPLVETEFWNGDALFMPQFHAARDIHDVYRIKNPTHAKAIEEPYLSNVKAVHENGGNSGSRGWNYQFDNEFTRRLILRSQGTVLSAHQLHKAKIPGKYFGIARCFRYDKVDATHLSDFYQTEGIVLGNDVNLRTLLGFLEMFAKEIAGATEVKYVPGYFPFTEPSIEVHIKHPKLGWFELGGSGIFRPEVTKAMGIDVPVLAWGIGIDRMALMALGLNDLRELFSEDIERVRLRKAKF